MRFGGLRPTKRVEGATGVGQWAPRHFENSRNVQGWCHKAVYGTEGKHVSYRLKHLGEIKGVLEALGKVVRASTSLG